MRWCQLTVCALCLAAPSLASAQQSPWAPTREPRAEPAVADFHHDAAGRVRLVIHSEGAAQSVVVEHRRTDAVTWDARALRNLLGHGACTTPCELFVPDGTLTLRAEARGLRRTDTRFGAPRVPSLLLLRAPTQRLWNLGVGLTAAGAVALVALAGLGIAAQSSGDGLPTAALVGGSLGVAALLGVGIPLVVTQSAGVASVTPLAE